MEGGEGGRSFSDLHTLGDKATSRIIMGGRNVSIRTTEKRVAKKKVVLILKRPKSNRLQHDFTEEHIMVSGVHSTMNEGPKKRQNH